MKLPKKFLRYYEKNLRYAGVSVSAERFVFVAVVLSVVFSVIITTLISFVYPKHLVFILVGLFLLMFALLTVWLNLKANEKGEFVETILPDVLDLTAANLKAGMTTDKALLLAARPEFGIFKDDIYKAGKNITLGRTLPQALKELSRGVKSEKVSKVISLIISGYKAGGKLSTLLAQTSRSLKNRQVVESKVQATVVSYIVFISITILIGAPFMFGTATFLVDALSKILAGIEVPATAGRALFVTISEITLSSDIIVPFVIVLLVTTSVLGSLVIGQIRKGRALEGVRIMPVFIAVSIVLFFLVKWTLNKVLGVF